MDNLSLEDLLDHFEKECFQQEQELALCAANIQKLRKQSKMIEDRIAAKKKGSNGKAAPQDKDSGE